MRWKVKEIPEYRIVKRFLFFPKCINDEWRWLEIAYILQHYTYAWGWEDKRFMKKEDKVYNENT